jgi:hypothetical protein
MTVCYKCRAEYRGFRNNRNIKSLTGISMNYIDTAA